MKYEIHVIKLKIDLHSIAVQIQLVTGIPAVSACAAGYKKSRYIRQSPKWFVVES